MNDLNDDQLVDQITDIVMERILRKVAQDLSEEDMKELEILSQDDKHGKKVKKYLSEKVPNLETIIFEELQKVRKQALA